MSQTLTLELPDEVYETVKQAVETTGQTPAEWIVTDLDRRLSGRDGSSERAQPLPPPDVPPGIYEILQQIAPQMGKTTEEVVVEWKVKYGAKPRPQLTEEEWEAARQRLLQHAGAANSGDPYSADNERIDADLAREYGNTHEEVFFARQPMMVCG
jgi:hypothetical protein